MGYNSSKFDQDSHYNAKTLKQLQALLKDSESFSERYAEFKQGWHNEHVEDLRRRIAERIGKKQ